MCKEVNSIAQGNSSLKALGNTEEWKKEKGVQ
jgi:hypothetical protein